MTAKHSGQLTGVAISDVETPAVLALIWTKVQSPALRELLTYSRDAFGGGGQMIDEDQACRPDGGTLSGRSG